MTATPELVCTGCGAVVATAHPTPFRCPNADVDDGDHVLKVKFDREWVGDADSARALFANEEANPFLKYRKLSVVYQAALARGMTDAQYVALVTKLDQAIAQVDGTGFVETPMARERELASNLGLGEGGHLWTKNETHGPGGSHKARHLMGILIWLELLAATDPEAERKLGDLAIASCGNAALGASVIAKAGGRKLQVFVPPDANPAVIAEIQKHGGVITPCPRERASAGDPCYLKFRDAVAEGAVPFAVQGSENGLTIDGGKTLGYEMISVLLQNDVKLDRLFVQVGGGALGSSLVQAFRDGIRMGIVSKVPRLHCVQTSSAAPLARAWELMVEYVADMLDLPLPDEIPARAAMLAEVSAGDVEHALRHAAIHRGDFMWPWEEAPSSIATGILDDETYDWLALVEAMIRTGGWPVLASESLLAEAHAMVQAKTAVRPCVTGAAGLAGALAVSQTWGFEDSEQIAVLVTGVDRGR